MIVAAVFVLVRGMFAPAGGLPEPPPALNITSATASAGVVAIRFRVADDFGPQPGGWGSRGYHIHARMDGRELMPGPQDIRRAEGEYLWTLPSTVATDAGSIRLFWSDLDHLAVPGTDTPAEPIRRPPSP